MADAASNTAGCWNADGRLLQVCAKGGPSYPMEHPCVRLSINFLTKVRSGCKRNSSLNLLINTGVKGHEESAVRRQGCSGWCTECR